MNDKNEIIWKDIPGYEGLYKVSNTGEIYSMRENKNLSLSKDRYGYVQIILYKNGESKTYKVHRLVALAFIPNPDKKPSINHLDGNPRNNRVENLEWCTASENQQHRRYVLKSGNRRVKRIETDTIYDSIKQAAEDNSSHIPNIVRACANNSTAAGFHLSYV